MTFFSTERPAHPRPYALSLVAIFGQLPVWSGRALSALFPERSAAQVQRLMDARRQREAARRAADRLLR